MFLAISLHTQTMSTIIGAKILVLFSHKAQISRLHICPPGTPKLVPVCCIRSPLGTKGLRSYHESFGAGYRKFRTRGLEQVARAHTGQPLHLESHAPCLELDICTRCTSGPRYGDWSSKFAAGGKWRCSSIAPTCTQARQSNHWS